MFRFPNQVVLKLGCTVYLPLTSIMDSTKANSEGIEHAAWEKEQTAPSKADAPVKRCQADSLSVWHFARQFKMASLIAMIAAFSASLDGYRKLSRKVSSGLGFD